MTRDPNRMTEHTVISFSDDLSMAELAGEMVVLDQKKGTYYGLNEIGAQILRLAREPRPIREIVDTLLGEYQVTPEQLTADVLAFVADLEASRLIRVAR